MKLVIKAQEKYEIKLDVYSKADAAFEINVSWVNVLYMMYWVLQRIQTVITTSIAIVSSDILSLLYISKIVWTVKWIFKHIVLVGLYN